MLSTLTHALRRTGGAQTSSSPLQFLCAAAAPSAPRRGKHGAVPVDLIRTLRNETGATIYDVRKALEAADNDLSRARESLRTTHADQYERRRAAMDPNNPGDGVVCAMVDEDQSTAAMVHLGCTTDFVSRTQAVRDVSKHVASELLRDDDRGADELRHTWQRELQRVSGSVGETVTLCDAVRLRRRSAGVLCQYVHNTTEPGVGRIGVLLSLECEAAKNDEHRQRLSQAGKQLAMQVAAMSPRCVSIEDIPVEDTRAELERARQALLREGKARDALDAEARSLAGLRSWAAQRALLEQPLIMDDSLTVSQYVLDLAHSVNAPVYVRTFSRFAVQ